MTCVACSVCQLMVTASEAAVRPRWRPKGGEVVALTAPAECTATAAAHNSAPRRSMARDERVTSVWHTQWARRVTMCSATRPEVASDVGVRDLHARRRDT